MTTKHKQDCKMVFGRKDATCPRCQELLNGAKPVEGWSAYKKQMEAQRIKAIYAHCCIKSNCGPVCTAFDW